MKMFRGLGQDHVARRLVLRGWPEPAAARMAEFMCGADGGMKVPPRWEELVGSTKETLPYTSVEHPEGSVEMVDGKIVAFHEGPKDTPSEISDTMSKLARLGGEGYQVQIGYTNHRGEHAVRTITPTHLRWGSTEWHPEPQWLLRAFDHDKGADRDFALSGFRPLP